MTVTVTLNDQREINILKEHLEHRAHTLDADDRGFEASVLYDVKAQLEQTS